MFLCTYLLISYQCIITQFYFDSISLCSTLFHLTQNNNNPTNCIHIYTLFKRIIFYFLFCLFQFCLVFFYINKINYTTLPYSLNTISVYNQLNYNYKRTSNSTTKPTKLNDLTIHQPTDSTTQPNDQLKRTFLVFVLIRFSFFIT